MSSTSSDVGVGLDEGVVLPGGTLPRGDDAGAGDGAAF